MARKATVAKRVLKVPVEADETPKSADAFRTISEVAEELDVPKHVLRFWEARFTQIRPMKRGGGRRFYRPEDVDLIRGIQHLLHNEGFTIRGVQKILRKQGADVVKSCWRKGAAPLTAADRAAGREGAEAERAPAGRKSKTQISDADRERVVREVIANLEACRDILAPPAAPRIVS